MPAISSVSDATRSPGIGGKPTTAAAGARYDPPDDMARPDRHGENRKKSAEELPRHAQEEEAEQVEAEVEHKQARDTAQDQLGNQGVATLLGLPSVKPGQAGVALEGNQDRDRETGRELGGDDDAPPDGPLTLEDLVRSWNPTTRRGQDTVEEALGELQGLPPEDEVLLAAVRSDPSPLLLPRADPPDALLQPSGGVVGVDLGPYVRQAARWGSGSALHRTWARILSPPDAFLVDPDGRLIFTRARTAALATMLVLDGTALARHDASALVGFTLELACRSGHVDAAIAQVRASGVRLPLAARVLAPLLEPMAAGAVTPRPLPASGLAHLSATIADLLALPSALTLLPSLVEPPPEDEEEDDPLGIDRLVTDLTGGAPDPLAGTYEVAREAAENLAGACARLRVHAAGMLAAIASVCALWTSGAPTEQLMEIATAFDRDVAQVLGLLLEIGRAARARSVPPAGVRNGLKRAARQLDAAAALLPERVAELVGGVLPVIPEVPEPTVSDPSDALSEAWADGDAARALAWVRAQPASLDRDAAVAVSHLDAVSPAALAALSARAGADGRPALAGALALCAGVSALRAGDLEGAARSADAELAIGLSRRSGAWIAAAALLGMEARGRTGREEEVARLRHHAARICWLLGARASLSLLLRWRPPDPEAWPET